MNFDIYFPLFENILQGDLNPLLPANDDGYRYAARLEQMIIVPTKDTGNYGIKFLPLTPSETLNSIQSPFKQDIGLV
jgi:hypothetical protein